MDSDICHRQFQIEDNYNMPILEIMTSLYLEVQ